MENILAKLKEAQGVLGVYLVGKGGNLLYGSSSLDSSPIALSGLVASLKGYITSMLEEVKLGNFSDMIVDGSAGRFVISQLKNGDLLAVFLTNSGNLGLVKFAISNSIDALNKLI
jgi:predicted regulator of Ras-like GTPase activity (Roadblock/LC7/MglB family)